MTSLLDFPVEVILEISECLKTRDMFSLQQASRGLRAILRPKVWQCMEILTTMEDETVGSKLIGSQGHVQIGNINVKFFCEQIALGHFDDIFPHINRLNIVEESPFTLAEHLRTDCPNDDNDIPGMFAYLLNKLLSRETLPKLSSVTIDRVLTESVEEKETALNRILCTRCPDIRLEFVLHPSYGLKWFSQQDSYLFNRLTNIECYTSADVAEDAVLTFDSPLPKSLESFSLQNDVVIDTERFKQLFAQCDRLHTLDLDISKVLYLEAVNWIPASVSDLFIHVSSGVAEIPTGIKKITSTSVERLALDGNFWSVLPTLRFPNLKHVDLNVHVDEHGIPEENFCRSVGNVLLDTNELDSVVVNFAIEGLPLMIPVRTASSVHTVRMSNSWRKNYSQTSRKTSLEAMNSATKHFPKMRTLEVALSGLRCDGQLAYMLNTTAVILKSTPNLNIRFLAADKRGIRASDDLFALMTLFTEKSARCSASWVLELDRSKIKTVYKLGALDSFRSALSSQNREDMKDFIDIVELVLDGR